MITKVSLFGTGDVVCSPCGTFQCSQESPSGPLHDLSRLFFKVGHEILKRRFWHTRFDGNKKTLRDSVVAYTSGYKLMVGIYFGYPFVECSEFLF